MRKTAGRFITTMSAKQYFMKHLLCKNAPNLTFLITIIVYSYITIHTKATKEIKPNPD